MTRSSAWVSLSSAAGAVAQDPAFATTNTRSARPSTSGTSLETRSTATPESASLRMRANSVRAPTSTPRVGSSSSSTSQPCSSHRASTTFCWLPPESVRTGRVGRAVARELRGHVADRGQLGVAAEEARPREPAQRGSETLRDTGSVSSRPWLLRSSGQRPTPARTADRTEPPAAHARARAPSPPSAAGAEHGLQDLRAPRPDQAGEPDDLAGPHREETSSNSPGRESPSTSSTTAPDGVRARRGTRTRWTGRSSAGSPRRWGCRGPEVAGHRAAVLEHRDPVADLADLLQPVRDVDHRDAVGGRSRTPGTGSAPLPGRARRTARPSRSAGRPGTARAPCSPSASRRRTACRPRGGPGSRGGPAARSSSRPRASASRAGRTGPGGLVPEKDVLRHLSQSTRSSSW